MGVLLATAFFVGPATASDSYRYWSHDPQGTTDWAGEKVTTGFPTSSQRNITYGDSMVTSIWAANNMSDGNGRGVQQGIKYTWGNVEDPGCDTQGVSSPASYNFVEFYDYGNYECYYEADASGGTAYTQQVLEDSSNNWRAYWAGNYSGHNIYWSTCGHNACLLQAWAEDVANAGNGSLWYAKFNGGIVPWQFYNGTIWGKITNDPTPYLGNQYWSKDMTNFPDGLWWFEYSH